MPQFERGLQRLELKIGAVMKNGRLYDPMTLDEIWPDPRKRPAAWFHGDDAAPTAP